MTLDSGGSESKLDEQQASVLEEHLETTLHPTADSIVAWVQQQFQVTYTTAGMTTWLHAHGFSYKQPVGIPKRTDPEKQKAFEKAYTKLMKSLKPQDVVVFCDAVHPSMGTKLSHGWNRTGEDFPIQTTASRTRVNVLGSLELKSMTLTSASHDLIDSDAMEKHLKAVRAQYPQAPSIHMILDNGSYNRSDRTKATAKTLGIELCFLPPYSPQYNPIERV